MSSTLTSLAAMLNRVLLVLGSFVCGLLLLDALFSGLEWVVTGDERELTAVASFLAEAAVPLVVIAACAYCRERFRRTLEARRKLVEAGPWARQDYRRGPLMLDRAALHKSNNFDALRVLAALAVLVSSSFPIAYGEAGVQPLASLSRGQTNLGTAALLVFFAISGYLITRSFDRRPRALRFLRHAPCVFSRACPSRSPSRRACLGR